MFWYHLILAFITTFTLVVTSAFSQSLFQNPGKGVNFYGNIQKRPVKVSAETAYDDLLREDCSKASTPSGCERDSLYHNPGLECQIKNPISCDYSNPYRTYDGSCNNLHVSRLGMKNQCYRRFIPAHYEGFGVFRKSVKGGLLPEPRKLSVKIYKDHHRPVVNVTSQFTFFGEYSILDLVQTVKKKVDCCSKDNMNDPECKSISVSSDDPFYSQFNKTCLNFHRSSKCHCETQKRAQINGVSAYMDESQLYGLSQEDVNKLRSLDGTGQLKLPDSSSEETFADSSCPTQKEANCFQGSDFRLSGHAILTSHATIFMREHNRIAKELKQINPHWGEEKLFQEARKILSAEHQCIFFKEFLPILLTPRIMEEFDLTVPAGKSGKQYNSNVIPGIWNEFAISSFRLHSLIRKDIGALNLRVKDLFLNPPLLCKQHMTEMITGLRQVRTEQYDRYMIDDLTNYLFQKPGVSYGKDLESLTIQRNRDHGLAPYIEVVKFCSEGAILISSFEDLYTLGLMSEENANLLKRNYAAVEDIDMAVGMQLEKHMPGSITGPSTVCINAKQFYSVQKGDRFYFDNIGPNAPFTTGQRIGLKQCSWARILCDNTDTSHVSKNPFLIPSDENSVVSCNEIPKMDLTLWKD